VEIPASIRRIEPLPASALALLNTIPSLVREVRRLRVLLEQEPLLLNAVGQVGIASGKYAGGNPMDFPTLFERLGATDLIEIAITLLVRGYLRRALSVLEDHRYWRYTLACAVCCQEIALSGDDNKLIAYVAGLLHDIGRLVLVAAYPDRYANC
jgi:hypothetical protein